MADVQRGNLAHGAETLTRTSASIFRSQAVAVETEQIGDDIISDLNTQRESLHRTRDRVSSYWCNITVFRILQIT